MSTQQDIYAAGSENHPPMLNKDNYVPWSSCLLHYAKSRPNGKLIYNSILNGPYVRRMIPEPGDPARTVLVPKTFHEQTDDELAEAEIKQIEADDQAIQTILLGLPKDIYAAVNSSDYTQLYDFLKYNQKEVDELRVERLGKSHDPLALVATSNYPVFHQDQPSPNRQMQMVGGNGGNQYRQFVRNQNRNQNGIIVVLGIAHQNANQIRNGNVVAARAEGNVGGNNGNKIRCYNCRGLGHLARNCIAKPRRRDAAYLQTQLLIAQKEEVGI
ncbi:reverse transcriptase domain-containing protein [Tanacetum coccineum]